VNRDVKKSALLRIDECLSKLRETAGPQDAVADTSFVGSFQAALEEDLNVSAAWAVVFDWVREINRRLADGSVAPQSAASALAAWKTIDSVLGVGVPEEVAVRLRFSLG
jgi:cysteinyl-tRNA synthetase